MFFFDESAGLTAAKLLLSRFYVQRPLLAVRLFCQFQWSELITQRLWGRTKSVNLLSSLLLLKPQGCRWPKLAWLAGRGRHTLSHGKQTWIGNCK